jgi:hypothetical protein
MVDIDCLENRDLATLKCIGQEIRVTYNSSAFSYDRGEKAGEGIFREKA